MAALDPVSSKGFSSHRSASQPADLAFGSSYRAAWRLTGYFLLAVVTVSLIAAMQGVFIALKSRYAEFLPMVHHRVCCWLLDLNVETRGSMSTIRPTLFVCNHSSYLDISVLGSKVRGSFVAKSEVAKWPLFGLFAKLQRTVFIDRRRRTAHKQRDDLIRRLEAGDNLILFPEGTSNDGNRTLPFRSSLFAVAERVVPEADGKPHPLTVQPVSIAYVRLNGMPIGRSLRPYFAWYGDMSLLDHLWRVAGLGRVTITVEFHPPVSLAQFPSRKALSEHCQRMVAEGVAAAVSGRPAEGDRKGARSKPPVADPAGKGYT